MKASWMAGDFGKIAALNRKWGEDFVDRLDLKPGMKVLDIACGTGNQALPAAHKGANVTGVDIATNLLAQARERAAAEKLAINFIEGDAEELPFEDASFDVVYSMFGAMFAPRPERVAAELKRVCKPGGMVAMGNWTPEGVPGQIFRATAKYLPPPPGLQPPSMWGVEDVVRQRLGDGFELKMQKVRARAEYAEMKPMDVVNLFREWFGPTKMAFARLDPENQQKLASDIEQIFANANNHPSGGMSHDAEYLEVQGRRK
ncbi:class I SAM-dependent methyltransferase [Candidatus Korobacter versatilis]|nr:methyltransferase domain-containing protein [Candidatus Koribacter versatilis]